MALYPRMTRTTIRLVIDALQAYALGLLPEDRQAAEDTITELQRIIKSANYDNRRRAAEKRAAERTITERTTKEREGESA